MKLVSRAHKIQRYPHLIIRTDNTNRRWLVSVSNTPVALGPDTVFSVVGEGYVDETGGVTALGRLALEKEMKARSRITTEQICLVWSDTDCTYVTDGSARQGTRPPVGNLVVSDRNIVDEPIDLVSIFYIELPDGCTASHLCLRRCGDLVHISLGEPLVLADFTEAPLGTASDPRRVLRSSEGAWIQPLFYRGVRVERIIDDRLLVGPVQPIACGAYLVLHDPWPDQIDEGCQDLAGRTLSRDLLDAAWRALDPLDPSVIYVGVREAA